MEKVTKCPRFRLSESLAVLGRDGNAVGTENVIVEGETVYLRLSRVTQKSGRARKLGRAELFPTRTRSYMFYINPGFSLGAVSTHR